MSEKMNNGTPEPEPTENELIAIRRQKLRALRDGGQDPFGHTGFDFTHGAADIHDCFERLENQTVRIAGRVMSKRDMGKAFFCDLQDSTGRVQLYVKVDDLGEEAFAAFKKIDISDIAGVEGVVFRTRRGEISVHCKTVVLLSKSLRPLPEKFHGLKDGDLRYRRRYLDLIMNKDSRRVFVTRSRILDIIRREMAARGYLEVETPVLHNHSTNAAARPFRTHHNTLDLDMVLRVELELHLKRLIIGGFDRVYEIGRIFRNEGMSVKHNPEFTMMEMYQAYTDYHGMMKLCEELYRAVASELLGGGRLTYQGVEIDFSAPWRRLTMCEAVREYAGVDFDGIQTDGEAAAAAKEHGLPVEDGHRRGDIINLFFEHFAEDKLIQPVFICDYPIEISPLAKKTKYDARLTERFEVFIFGREMGNAFTELNDPEDQRERFTEQALKTHKEGEFVIDEDFVTAMEYGMPPTGGMGLGIDRMVMLFTDSASIRDVLLFPTMRPVES
ncbi:MAG: lysine--tRNA ligase [Oscillospiraceae bacterium]|nr:lysine--tRNA ligase [Oscillospiraceae bacterium]